jgi:release factor glutamine methyltransferase
MSETVQQALSWAVSELSNADSSTFETPKLDAEILLAHCLNQSRTWLKTWPEKTLSCDELESFKLLVKRRKDTEPVAYIIGKQDFWTFTLKVTTATLIPRPETEHLVEFALSKIAFDEDCHIADLGTGSGAIALAIASERPQSKLYALDISPQALQVAEDNAQRLNLTNIKFEQGHWLRAWQGEQFDIIVSNPPYIDANDKHLEDLAFEPLNALVAADNGLGDIAEITQQAERWLKSCGWLIFEHGYQQGDAVQHILRQQGFIEVGTVKDYAGLARVTFGVKA